MAEVIYAKPAERDHWGRNGAINAVGLHAHRVIKDYLVLQPIGTRGHSTAADLIIPVDEIDNVIKMLESLK